MCIRLDHLCEVVIWSEERKTRCSTLLVSELGSLDRHLVKSELSFQIIIHVKLAGVGRAVAQQAIFPFQLSSFLECDLVERMLQCRLVVFEVFRRRVGGCESGHFSL